MRQQIPELKNLEKNVKENVIHCLKEPYDDGYKRQVLRLIEEDPKALTDAFYKNLAFGTGGIRGIMGVGSNRLNEYNIESATQGLANYILKQPKKRSHHRVFISFDNRKHSHFFAKTAARVLAANDIEAYIVRNLRPTPLASFGCIYYHCIAAIMITASHNPPEYNGYKVYWKDGAQVLPPHDIGIINEVDKITELSQVKMVGLRHPLIKTIGEDLDKIYIKTIKNLQNFPKLGKQEGSNLKIIYTNLHGTGITLVPQALRDWGFTSIEFVKEQLPTDGKFPFALKPNPEEKETLEIGVKYLMKKKADLMIATDPDCDRMGIVIPKGNKAVAFTGNQIACICLYHLLENRKNLPENAAFVKSIVTTELFRSICEHYKKTCFDVLTGFKYIAEKIREWEISKKYRYIFGAEESYGYLYGTYVRDKDAVISSCLIAEATLHAKSKNLSLYEILREIYQRFGVFREKVTSITFEDSPEGMNKMKTLMENLRKSLPKNFANISVKTIEDFFKRDVIDVKTQKKFRLDLPKSDVLCFWLEDHSKVIIRRSGTEPTIKCYFGTEMREFSNVDTAIKECDKKLDALLNDTKKLFK